MTNDGARFSTFAWRDEFAVGVAQIDSQHRRLIEMIASFYDGLARKQGRQALGTLLTGLLDYTRFHFATERELMERAGYAATAAHEAQHAVFVAKVADMAERFAEGRLLLSIEATSFIREWLANHILVTDKQLGAWLKAHGVE